MKDKLLFTVIILVIFVSSNFQLIKNYQSLPSGTTYLGATGFFFDYYQFLSWMRDGNEGKFLIASRYIPEQEKPVLLHPFFPVLGFIGGRMGLSLPVAYHLARNLFLGLFLTSLYILVRTIFNEIKYQRLAYLTILLSSAFPYINLNNGGVSLGPLIPFWQTFYALQKFDIPVHHLLAKSLFVILIALVISSRRRLIAIVLVSVLLVLVNPASMSFMLVILCISIVLARGPLFFKVSPRMSEVTPYKELIVIFLSVIPFMLYNYHIFTSGNPWKYYYYGEKVGRYMVSLWEYIGSLGPLFLTSILSLKYFRKFSFGEVFLSVWNFLPAIMFPFVGRQIPFSMSRLFSVDLYIPSTILTVFFFRNFHRFQRSQPSRLTSFTPVVSLFLITILMVSLGLGITYSVGSAFSYKYNNYYNVFLPKELVSAIDFIHKNSRKSSTILAGENLSNMLPSVISNRVVWGRKDAYADYNAVTNQVHDIYLRRIDNNKILDRLKQWRVQYIIFGIDHVRYDEFLAKGKINGIKEVFRSEDVVVGEVQ